jgi:sterol desaturase/sphingolipid hydroxylase (fatty acid hydroxylase superfamily)
MREARVSFVSSLAGNLYTTWLSTFSIAAMMWGLERLFPKGKVSVASQARALKYWLFAGIGTATAITIYSFIGEWLDPRPLFILPLNGWLANPWVHWSMYVIAPVLGMILYDFFGYWLHRAQHRWFWRLHSVHHSIEELSGINSYFHWTEQFFRIAFISLPAAYLVGIDGLESVFAIELLLKIQGYYLHSPNSIHLGPVIRRVIADNRFHRIHHSVEPQHFDRNFGAGTSVWDQLFGTAYFPAENEWPRTGIVDQPEVSTVRGYLLASRERIKNSGSAAIA